MALHLKYLIAASFILFSSVCSAEISFKNKTIVLINGKLKKTLKVEVASTQQEHMQGLMNRKKLSENQGMLFVFAEERVREFWMKNTLIDLDIAYFNKERKIIDIQQMQAQTSVVQTHFPTYPSKLPAQYALEMNKGWFKKNKFPEGTKFEFVSGPSSK
jgi:uncharacterized membrane protein (UPF0127 family)